MTAMQKLNRDFKFITVPRGALEPNNCDDPLNYYYHPLVGFIYKNRVRQALSLLQSHYDSVLEVGYGSGIMMPSLKAVGKSICGIDLHSDPKRVSANLKKIGVDVLLSKGDILSADYPPESFDLVIAISILEHISELRPVIEKIAFVVRPNGHFLVGMPRVDNLMKLLFPLIGFFNIKDHHVSCYHDLLKASKGHFRLVKFAKLPSCLPVNFGLYFNMLFVKESQAKRDDT